jgi:hypothetical protein
LEETAVAPENLASLTFPFNARNTAEGCRALYGIDVGAVLRTDAPREVFERGAALRAKGYTAAYAEAFAKAGIMQQLCFCDSNCADILEKRSIAPHIRILAYIDHAILGLPSSGHGYFEDLERTHGALNSLEDFLCAIDRIVDGWPPLGVVGMKLGLAYNDHGLDLRLPSLDEAKRAFSRKQAMSPEETRQVRDFAIRHSFDACVRNRLPIVIHTGFLAFGTAPLAGSRPDLLEPVFGNPRFKDASFVLLHGGYPYVGETGFLAARYPNVYIDFTWLSWMNPARFHQALGEWLAVVPLNRFMWGSDSGSNPEGIVGIDAISRKNIFLALEAALDSGVVDEARALAFVEGAFFGNARRVFSL